MIEFLMKIKRFFFKVAQHENIVPKLNQACSYTGRTDQKVSLIFHSGKIKGKVMKFP